MKPLDVYKQPLDVSKHESDFRGALSMRRAIRTALRRLGRVLTFEVAEQIQMGARNEVVAQKLLVSEYCRLLAEGRRRLPDFREVGFRKYSQFDEDGVLLFLFALIRPINRTCVEICAGDGKECNTTNLILNHGWWGHLFDGNEECVSAGRKFFASHKDTFWYPPSFTCAWITAENVNDYIRESGVTGPIDLLSLDIDGMDYWVWKAITAIEPRVVVCETNYAVPSELAITVPYDPAFKHNRADYHYFGASLLAMTKLAHEKGYRLVGAHKLGYNAFFVKNGVAEDLLPAVDVSSVASNPHCERRRQNEWPKLKSRVWQEV
jgi:hypothetical protein